MKLKDQQQQATSALMNVALNSSRAEGHDPGGGFQVERFGVVWRGECSKCAAGGSVTAQPVFGLPNVMGPLFNDACSGRKPTAQEIEALRAELRQKLNIGPHRIVRVVAKKA